MSINAPAQIVDARNSRAVNQLFGGTAGQRLMANNWNINALRPVAPDDSDIRDLASGNFMTNATLRKDEWEFYDKAVVNLARERLVVTQELISRGLSYPLPNALGVLSIEWDNVGDLEPAQLSMSGLNEADKDQLDYGTAGMPIPLIHKEFTLNLRQLEAARRNGRRMDTTHAEVATRKVAELIEQIIFTGANIQTANGRIWGLLNQPVRNTGSVTGSWATITGEQVISDAMNMIEKARVDNMFGPFLLFVPGSVGTFLSRDYKANGSDTVLQRLRDIPGIAGIVPTNRLTGNNTLLVQMTSDVIQMIDGIRPTLVEWDSRGGFEMNFKIIAIMLPRLRNDYANQSGIVHYS